MKKINVMLVLEGTYPYQSGGVSTWAHTLCEKVKNANYTIYSTNANFTNNLKYTLPPSVKNLIQVPQWAPNEPHEYIDYGSQYVQSIIKKKLTNDLVIEHSFIPLFHSLLSNILSTNPNMKTLDSTFKSLWLYFENFDFKTTMLNEAVWKTYREFMIKHSVNQNDPVPSLLDLTIGMRWVYRLLIPLAIPVPKVDIVHLTLSGFVVIPALIASYTYNTPIILTEHGVFIRERLLAINSSGYSFFLKKFLILFSENIARLSYYKAEVILSVNDFNKKWEILYGANPRKLKVIHNGVDHSLFIPRPKPKHLRGLPTVVSLARVFELKDIITMIHSCAVVKKEIPDVLFMLYGDDNSVPEYTKKCKKLITKLKLQENFKLMGASKNPELLFCEGDVSILTSISEGFPYTVLESMSCGIPVVATDVGGTAEALDDGSGFICKPKDPEGIGKNVVRLLKDRNLRNKMGNHARQRIIDNFTLQKFISSYESTYHKVFYKTEIKHTPELIYNLKENGKRQKYI